MMGLKHMVKRFLWGTTFVPSDQPITEAELAKAINWTPDAPDPDKGVAEGAEWVKGGGEGGAEK